MTEVKIKTKVGDTVLATMQVWVVWATPSVTPYEDVQFYPSTTIGSYKGGVFRDKYWRFVYTIEPAELITNGERPNLSGASETKVPGAEKNYSANNEGWKCDSAKYKWDLSRQGEIEIYNSGGIPKQNFQNIPLFSGQPKAQDKPWIFPTNPAEGNDDPSEVSDEDANPYAACAESGLVHSIGQISSADGPRFQTPTIPVAAGTSVVIIANFREFARLEISSTTSFSGTKTWFLVSDYKEWHHVLASLYGEAPSGEYYWGDIGSHSGEGSFQIPEN